MVYLYILIILLLIAINGDTKYQQGVYGEAKNNMTSTTSLSIVTPSIRPDNLIKLKKQIDFYIDKYPNINVRWIIVYDAIEPVYLKLFKNVDYIIEDSIYNPDSVKGNAQRNLAFTKIKDGWIYLLDDDTNLPSTPFQLISEGGASLSTMQIHTFTCHIPGHNIGDNVELKMFKIDSGCFLLHKNVLGNEPYSLKRDIGKRFSDGRFIERIAKSADQQHHYGYEPFNWNNLHL